MKKRVFISFDYDHDEDLRNLLIGQSRNPDSPFDMANWSVKEPMSGDWCVGNICILLLALA
jgi:hypothetical protein